MIPNLAPYIQLKDKITLGKIVGKKTRHVLNELKSKDRDCDL